MSEQRCRSRSDDDGSGDETGRYSRRRRKYSNGSDDSDCSGKSGSSGDIHSSQRSAKGSDVNIPPTPQSNHGSGDCSEGSEDTHSGDIIQSSQRSAEGSHVTTPPTPQSNHGSGDCFESPQDTHEYGAKVLASSQTFSSPETVNNVENGAQGRDAKHSVGEQARDSGPSQDDKGSCKSSPRNSSAQSDKPNQIIATTVALVAPNLSDAVATSSACSSSDFKSLTNVVDRLKEIEALDEVCKVLAGVDGNCSNLFTGMCEQAEILKSIKSQMARFGEVQKEQALRLNLLKTGLSGATASLTSMAESDASAAGRRLYKSLSEQAKDLEARAEFVENETKQVIVNSHNVVNACSTLDNVMPRKLVAGLRHKGKSLASEITAIRDESARCKF